MILNQAPVEWMRICCEETEVEASIPVGLSDIQEHSIVAVRAEEEMADYYFVKVNKMEELQMDQIIIRATNIQLSQNHCA